MLTEKKNDSLLFSSHLSMKITLLGWALTHALIQTDSGDTKIDDRQPTKQVDEDDTA